MARFFMENPARPLESARFSMVFPAFSQKLRWSDEAPFGVRAKAPPQGRPHWDPQPSHRWLHHPRLWCHGWHERRLGHLEWPLAASLGCQPWLPKAWITKLCRAVQCVNFRALGSKVEVEFDSRLRLGIHPFARTVLQVNDCVLDGTATSMCFLGLETSWSGTDTNHFGVHGRSTGRQRRPRGCLWSDPRGAGRSQHKRCGSLWATPDDVWQAYRSVEVYDDWEWQTCHFQNLPFMIFMITSFWLQWFGTWLGSTKGKCGSGRPGDCGDLQLGSQEPQPQEVLLSCLGDLWGDFAAVVRRW